MHDFYEYYKNINGLDTWESQSSGTPLNADVNLELNMPISPPEIERCIQNLKNGKACSPKDKISNEYIKYSKDLILPLTKLFNCVFDTGLIPESWTKGVIIPIFKNKGDPTDPKNYRPITILSCLGKPFTSILNKRLNTYLEANNLLHQNQAGLRSGYSCQDHIFTLYSIIDILKKKKKKKIFCAYIDFSAAFDKVHRASLWQKILENNINGKIFNVIYNMYCSIKSCVSLCGSFSSFFSCENGVRQGENLSPVLFALSLNDMQTYIESRGVHGIELFDNDQHELWLRLLVLLYADDTVILSDNADDFQNCLNAFNDYCNEWHLHVNLSKTKIIIFGARNTNNFNFTLGNEWLDITNTYHYLGITFSASGSFLNARKYISQ